VTAEGRELGGYRRRRARLGQLLEALPGEAAHDIVHSDDGQVKYDAWFVWDLDIEDGVTVADLFLEQKGRSLDATVVAPGRIGLAIASTAASDLDRGPRPAAGPTGAAP